MDWNTPYLMCLSRFFQNALHYIQLGDFINQLEMKAAFAFCRAGLNKHAVWNEGPLNDVASAHTQSKRVHIQITINLVFHSSHFDIQL